MKSTTLTIILALITIAATIAIMGAQQNANNGIAVVDFTKIMLECKQGVAMSAESELKNKHYVEARTNWLERKLLTTDEFKQIYSLVSKPTPTEADKAALKKLLDDGIARSQKLATLQSKKELSTEEKAELEELTSRLTQFSSAVTAQDRQFEMDLREFQTAKVKELTALVRDAVSEAAKKKNYTSVFSSLVTVWGENDLTQTVIDDLNKKK